MDYKTGSGSPSVDSIAALFNTDKHKKNKAIFQTLLYSIILDETSDESKQLQPSVIWVRDVFKTDYDTKANHLAKLFNQNFDKYADGVSKEILDAAPKTTVLS